jgi:hypothetical protein
LIYPNSRSSVSCFIDVDDSAIYAPHNWIKAKPRDYAILLVSFDLFEKEDRVEIPDEISIEQVSFVYLCASFLVFCLSQQKDAHLRVNVAVDARGLAIAVIQTSKTTGRLARMYIRKRGSSLDGLRSASPRKKEASVGIVLLRARQ